MRGETCDSIISSSVGKSNTGKSRTCVNLTLIDNDTEITMFALEVRQKFTLEALNI